MAFKALDLFIHLTPNEDKVYQTLRRYGCPVHSELLTAIVNDVNSYYNNLTTSDYRQVKRALYSLVNKGEIRRVRPGVYSAFGPERD